MLGYVEIFFLSRQGEAWKYKIDAGKTPRGVNHFWIFEKLISWLRTVLAFVESDSTQC